MAKGFTASQQTALGMTLGAACVGRMQGGGPPLNESTSLPKYTSPDSLDQVPEAEPWLGALPLPGKNLG